MQVLGVDREMGVSKLGAVALDGTTVHANASRHRALRMTRRKDRGAVKAEVADLLGKAEAAIRPRCRTGCRSPGTRAAGEAAGRIDRAKAVIEARAKERHARERAECEAGSRPAPPRQHRQASSGGRVRSRGSRGRCRPIRSI